MVIYIGILFNESMGGLMDNNNYGVQGFKNFIEKCSERGMLLEKKRVIY